MENLFHTWVVVAQILALAIVILVAIFTGDVLHGFAWDGSMKQFNWHPLLMILGMIVINGDAILMFRLFPKLSKQTVKIIHLTLQGTVVILGAIAIAAVFGYHNARGYANVHMVHSWIGIAQYVMFSLQWLLGFIIFFFPKLSEDYRVPFLPVHRYMGVALFAMATVAVISGIQEELMFHQPPDNKFTYEQLIGNFLGVAVVAFALVVGFLVTEDTYKRQADKTIEPMNQPLTSSPTQNYDSVDSVAGEE